MKQLLFILLVFCINTTLLKAESFSEFKEITLQICADDNRELKDKDSDTPAQTQIRSLITQPIYAYLYDNIINIDFTDTFATVTVNIINETTDETVYSDTYSNPTTINIDINSENAGSYFIEINTESISLQGIFHL